VFRSNELPRLHRERLIRHGFLRPALKGWLYAASPTAEKSDTTPWHASFWEFCARYCDERFSEAWHFSPQQSLDLHAERPTIPKQVVVHSTRAQNNRITLPFGCSLYALKQAKPPPAGDLEKRRRLRLFRPVAALVQVPRAYFESSPAEAQVVLASVSVDDLTARLVAGGHSTTAGWLAGALRHVGRADAADELLDVMKKADFDVRERDPFETSSSDWVVPPRPVTPIVGRLHRLWAVSRVAATDALQDALVTNEITGLEALDGKSFTASVDNIYQQDAYHSLSIEGYRVTSELVALVASGAWNQEQNKHHRNDRDALAARGYYQAFVRVREAAEQALNQNRPQVVRKQHRAWYRELFTPHVNVGLLEPAMLAGYRSHPVFLRGSRHVPPRWEVLGDAMPALFELLEQESDGLVRAVLAHWLLGYVHPFPDGNGRVARFAMNVLLATAGYPWTVIRVNKRQQYLEHLECASVAGDIAPFARFIVEELRWSAQLTRNSPEK
jgi:hypothetical protein